MTTARNRVILTLARLADRRKAREPAARFRLTDPLYTVDLSDPGRRRCRASRRYSGTSMTTVLSFELDRSTLNDGNPVTIVADGQTAYSSGPACTSPTTSAGRSCPPLGVHEHESSGDRLEHPLRARCAAKLIRRGHRVEMLVGVPAWSASLLLAYAD